MSQNRNKKLYACAFRSQKWEKLLDTGKDNDEMHPLISNPGAS